jgi:hypothetical protein
MRQVKVRCTKKRTATRRYFALFAICVLGNNALAQVEPTPWVSVDFPHGGCSLTVEANGSASIHFGAMPRWVRASPGTFVFEQLVKDLSDKSYPQSSRRLTDRAVGSVSLSRSQDLQYIDDGELVRDLLQRAWRARKPPMTMRELEDHNWVARACSLR